MRKDKYTRDELSSIVNDLMDRMAANQLAFAGLERKERYTREELSTIVNVLMDHLGDTVVVMDVEEEVHSDMEEYRRLHREYTTLVSAQLAGAKNGADVVRLTDECAAKGIVLVPGGECVGIDTFDIEIVSDPAEELEGPKTYWQGDEPLERPDKGDTPEE